MLCNLLFISCALVVLDSEVSAAPSRVTSTQDVECYLDCGNATIKLCNRSLVPSWSKDCRQIRIDNKFRLHTLIEHNMMRSQIASGETFFPSSGNMYALDYDRHLEYYAQRFANTCHVNYDGCNARDKKGPLGLNYLSLQSKWNADNQPDMRDVIRLWNQEIHQLNISIVDRYELGVGQNFTQLVWAATRHVGCGISLSLSTNITYVFCSYRTNGNVENATVYMRGKPCAFCRHCNKHYIGLCGYTMEFPSVSRAVLFPRLLLHPVVIVVLLLLAELSVLESVIS